MKWPPLLTPFDDVGLCMMVEISTNDTGKVAERRKKGLPSQRALAEVVGRALGVPSSTVRHWLRSGEVIQRLHFHVSRRPKCRG